MGDGNVAGTEGAPQGQSHEQKNLFIGRRIGSVPLFDDVEVSWQDQANCLGVDPELFFPERGESSSEAKKICRECIARTACLEYALNNGEKFGIWGGMSERQRRQLRAQRRKENSMVAS